MGTALSPEAEGSWMPRGYAVIEAKAGGGASPAGAGAVPPCPAPGAEPGSDTR